MELRKPAPDRPLGESFTCRYWQDNYEQIMEISRQTGRSSREVARDLMDDALRRYLSGAETAVESNGGIAQKIDLLIEQNRQTAERHEQLVRKYEQLEAQGADLRRGLIQDLRHFYGVLLETLSAAIGARQMAWHYLARTLLKQTGQSDKQIDERYQADKKVWIEEKERIVRLLGEGISKMPTPE